MTAPPKPPAPKTPNDIEIDVVNPRYEGATLATVAKALLQRPKKAAQTDNDEPPDEAESGGA